MKKIMFNDRYGLTEKVIYMQKTQTRRVEPDAEFESVAGNADSLEYEDGHIVAYLNGKEIGRHKCHYKIGEVVAVAQRYSAFVLPDHKFTFTNRQGVKMTARADQLEGWHNKMYVLADLMPYRIRITNIKAERIRDISDRDCFREGIMEDRGVFYYLDLERNRKNKFGTPTAAFKNLIGAISGSDLWNNDDWVIAYEFQLVM